MVDRGVGEVVGCAAEHDDVRRLVETDERDPFEVLARIAVRQEEHPCIGVHGAKVPGGRHHGGDDVVRVHGESGVAKRARQGVAGVRRGVRDQPERQTPIAEPLQRFDGAVDRFPRHRQHTVDVEEQSIHVHVVESRIAVDGARGRTGRTGLRTEPDARSLARFLDLVRGLDASLAHPPLLVRRDVSDLRWEERPREPRRGERRRHRSALRRTERDTELLT